MTVSEFIEWLKTQDQDAIVTCFHHDNKGSYYEQGGTCSRKEFTMECFEYTDFRNNEFTTLDKPWYNKRYLFIGFES